MLEDYYVKPSTIDRVRSCWLAPQIENYLEWLQAHGYSRLVFRYSTAVGLLEQGVDVNVIRAWLGHVSLETTCRYAEITLRGKMAAVAACLPPVAASISSRRGWLAQG